MHGIDELKEFPADKVQNGTMFVFNAIKSKAEK